MFRMKRREEDLMGDEFWRALREWAVGMLIIVLMITVIAWAA
jgi:hypothetical protein